MFLGKRKLKLKQQATFFSALAEMLQAGFSLNKSLTNLQLNGQLDSQSFTAISTQLNAGQTFSNALEPWVSTTTFFQLKIAEQHGNLEQCIHELGQFLFAVNEQTQKIRGLLLYPAMLFILLGGLCGSIKIWLLPQLTEFSKTLNTANEQRFSLNWETIFYIVVKILLVLIVIYLLKILYWWSKQKSLNRHIWYTQLPVVGRLYCLYSAYLCSFNLALLTRCGLELQQVCCYLQEFSPTSLYYQLGQELAAFLSSGEELVGFVRNYPFIPKELLFFLSNGDTKEELSKELDLFAQTSYRNLMRESERMLTWIQPLLFLVIAAVIIGTYLAILLPIYSSIGNSK